MTHRIHPFQLLERFKRKQKMKLTGTHNTMSYLPPKNWWGWLLRPFARCQNLPLMQQIDCGARAFDLRVVYERGKYCFAHGAVRFRGATVSNVLDELPDGSVVRMICENRRSADAFVMLCDGLEEQYPNLKFIGGYQKRPWVKLFTFTTEREGDMAVHQPVGSMASDARWYERFIPIAYARRKGFQKVPVGEGITLIDFIH